jgi:quercetin dioxygenase-like cupin family protein
MVRELLLRLLCGSCVFFVAVSGCSADEEEPAASSYAYATNGVLDQIEGATGARWKLVLDESSLGGKELEIAEVLIPTGTIVRPHTHGSVEIIYVLSGTYGHEVNGELYRLEPGMVGIVRPGDQVRHITSEAGEARLLIMWAPAGEAGRLLPGGKGTPVPPVPQVDALEP